METLWKYEKRSKGEEWEVGFRGGRGAEKGEGDGRGKLEGKWRLKNNVTWHDGLGLDNWNAILGISIIEKCD